MFFRKTVRVKIFTAALITAFLLFTACEQPGGVVRDEDATLRTLTVNRGTLSPAFSASCFEYSVTVRSDVEAITITATANSDKATVNGAGTKTLAEGTNRITVEVRAENGDSKTYAITVTRLDASVFGIETAQDMAKIGNDPSYPLLGDYLLLNDITLENWLPIGDKENPFTGEFDGNEKKITFNSFDAAAVSGKIYLGIFGYVKGASAAEKAAIKNLTIQSSVNAVSTMASGQAIGLVTGYAELAVIENITLTGTFAFKSEKTIFTGGAAGFISGDTLVKDCESSLTMNIVPGSGSGLAGVYNYAGGFVGLFRNGAGIENCHYSGDLIADNAANAVSGQVFVGGIAGGSAYAMSVNYHGYVKDSSFTGTVTGRAQGFWTFVGGIAATTVGGDVNNPAATTRIERCFVTGTVSNDGDQSGYPYIGGVVAYNYYGALVSQSYFSGTIISGGTKTTYACGGVVGYHSQFTAPNSSRVEECYSSGTANINNGANVVGTTAGSALAPVRCYTVTSPQPQAYYEGWDFDNVWKMGADYPKLKWQ